MLTPCKQTEFELVENDNLNEIEESPFIHKAIVKDSFEATRNTRLKLKRMVRSITEIVEMHKERQIKTNFIKTALMNHYYKKLFKAIAAFDGSRLEFTLTARFRTVVKYFYKYSLARL